MSTPNTPDPSTAALHALNLATQGVNIASDNWEAVRRKDRRPLGSAFMTKAEAEALKSFERAVERRAKAFAEVERLEAEACKAASLRLPDYGPDFHKSQCGI